MAKNKLEILGTLVLDHLAQWRVDDMAARFSGERLIRGFKRELQEVASMVREAADAPGSVASGLAYNDLLSEVLRQRKLLRYVEEERGDDWLIERIGAIYTGLRGSVIRTFELTGIDLTETDAGRPDGSDPAHR